MPQLETIALKIVVAQNSGRGIIGYRQVQNSSLRFSKMNWIKKIAEHRRNRKHRQAIDQIIRAAAEQGFSVSEAWLTGMVYFGWKEPGSHELHPAVLQLQQLLNAGAPYTIEFFVQTTYTPRTWSEDKGFQAGPPVSDAFPA